MAEGKDEKSTNPSDQLSESDTVDEELINPILKTSVEESQYDTIPGSSASHSSSCESFKSSSKPYCGERALLYKKDQKDVKR